MKPSPCVSQQNFQLRQHLTLSKPLVSWVEVLLSYSNHKCPVLSWPSTLGCYRLVAAVHSYAAPSPLCTLLLFYSPCRHPSTRPAVRSLNLLCLCWSLTLCGPISLLQMKLLLYTQPQDYFSKEKRKPNMYVISFIVLKAVSTPWNAGLKTIAFQ